MSLLDELNKLYRSDMYPFHMPGHKRKALKSELQAAYGIDITEIDDFDNLHEAEGILKESMDRAAGLFEAIECVYSINGATAGILASIYGLSKDSSNVILARNCHKAVYNAVMLAGANPIYIYPDSESLFEINAGISLSQITNILDENPSEDNVVVITSPTYEGIVSDIDGISKACHERGAILVVDSAHGAHFGFSDDFPKSAISQGADVVIASLHKTLPSPTQTAIVLFNEQLDKSKRENIKKMMKVFSTSSPSYILMAGIDECINLLSEKKDEIFNRYSKNLDDFYEEAGKLQALSVLTKDKLTGEGSFDLDKGKIVIKDNTLTFSGKELAEKLRNKFHLQPEMAAGSYVLMMTSIADEKEGFSRLQSALKKIDEELINKNSFIESNRSLALRLVDKIAGKYIRRFFSSEVVGDEYINLGANEEDAPTIELSIKEALLNEDTEEIPVELAEGKVSADYIVPYPPCVPIAVPGEVLSEDMIDKILKAINDGLSVNGVRDGQIIVRRDK